MSSRAKSAPARRQGKVGQGGPVPPLSPHDEVGDYAPVRKMTDKVNWDVVCL